MRGGIVDLGSLAVAEEDQHGGGDLVKPVEKRLQQGHRGVGGDGACRYTMEAVSHECHLQLVRFEERAGELGARGLRGRPQRQPKQRPARNPSWFTALLLEWLQTQAHPGCQTRTLQTAGASCFRRSRARHRSTETAPSGQGTAPAAPPPQNSHAARACLATLPGECQAAALPCDTLSTLPSLLYVSAAESIAWRWRCMPSGRLVACGSLKRPTISVKSAETFKN